MDLTVETIQEVSKTPGANYSNVRSTDGFKDLMAKEFGYLVSPIGFNIEVKLEGGAHVFVEGYGSPEINKLEPGFDFKISTEFPSLLNHLGEKKPGPYLLKVVG